MYPCHIKFIKKCSSSHFLQPTVQVCSGRTQMSHELSEDLIENFRKKNTVRSQLKFCSRWHELSKFIKNVFPAISYNLQYKFAVEEPRCHMNSQKTSSKLLEKKGSSCNEENLQPNVCSGRTQMSLINFQKTNSDQLEIFG